MVLVTVVNAKHSPGCDSCTGEYFLYLDVQGLRVETPNDIMNFITEWARMLEFNYIAYRGELHEWGYFLSELGRRKIFITVVPYDTYSWEMGKEIEEGRVVWMYIDEGSPFRRVYFIPFPGDVVRVPATVNYIIYGTGVHVTYGAESIKLDLDVSEEPSPDFIDYYRGREDIISLATSREIHTMVYPEADLRTKRVFSRILELKRKRA